MQKHNNVQQKHMYKMHTFTHASTFELGRCVTDVRPLLTPDVAQQGVFVWFPKATVREGGGGWSREAGLQPHVLLWFVCMSDCCMHMCVPVEAAGGLFARCHWMAVFVYGCMCIWFDVHMCVPEHSVESVVVYRLTVTDKHTLTTGVKKLNALYALFFPRRLPLSACLTFSPPIFIFYIFLSVILSCFFSLPDDFFLLLPPLSLHLWWF